MLQYTEESIFSSRAQTIVNPVNTVGVMGRGLALEFKKRHPEMFACYQKICADGTLRIGTLHIFRTPTRWIMNFPTKRHWRDPSRLEWIEGGLRRFSEDYQGLGITSIAFPMLGCGNGGLRWDVVEPLMFRYLDPLPIPVTLHVPK